ncbi:sigma-54 dependent transcriptional regulator [bacterium]|nr:sigma-54 dependent transcriptional regulator [bacterium]
MKILLLSKDTEIITAVQNYSDQEGDRLTLATTVKEASAGIGTREFDAVLLDCSIRPTELIGLAGERADELMETVVLLLGPLDHEQREMLGRRLSAHYSVDKPLRRQMFNETMQRLKMRSIIVRKAGLIGRSPAMEEIIQTIMQIGATPITILITGESGTGKEVIARAIHAVSQRSEEPFLAVNCAALAEGILESELFGHEKGSFTGATARRIGMFERADHGTIFLDEIGEIPHSTQIRLLRVLEEREIMRVGGTDVIPVDVRVITATNRNLGLSVEKGAFRRDLYYRIKVLDIFVPPLRERPEDIPLLLDRLVRLYAEENRLPLRRFTDESKAVLSRMRWTGNVRELRNFVESCLALTTVHTIGPDDIPPHLLDEIDRQYGLPVPAEKKTEQIERELIYRTLLDLKRDIGEIRELLFENRIVHAETDYPPIREVVPIENGNEPTLEELERQAIIDALDHTRGNRRKAARLLGIGERTLYRKLKQYRISDN